MQTVRPWSNSRGDRSGESSQGELTADTNPRTLREKSRRKGVRQEKGRDQNTETVRGCLPLDTSSLGVVDVVVRGVVVLRHELCITKEGKGEWLSSL